jgi:Skp family chaperone for outer membrane proteins
MRKTCLLVLTFSAAAGLAAAQESAAPAPKAERAQKIAVVNMERISAESLLGKGYAKKLDDLKNEIDAEGTKKQSDLNKLDAAIKALQDELDTKGNLLSPEAADKKRQEIVKKTRDRQAFLEDGQAELQRMRDRAQQQAQAFENEFQVKVRPHIEAVVKEKGIDILLDSRVVPVSSKDVDVSLEVINRSNDAERTAAKTAAPSAATAKPPAAAAPTPAPTPAPAPEKP